MATPQFHEESPLTLGEVKVALGEAEKRDTELNYRSLKAKEYLDGLNFLEKKKNLELKKKLMELNLTRLKDEHMAKILDFHPKTLDELRIVLQAYPLSMPKKDQESIVSLINEHIKA